MAGNGSQVIVRKAGDRPRTRTDWLDARHCFSSREPGNRNFGLLIVHNDDVVQPGRGFETHAHRDLEIITWPVEGTIIHRDSFGNVGELRPGQMQRMTAGSGITHSEHNLSPVDRARWVQMWVVPDAQALPPKYEDVDVADALDGAGLVPLVGKRNPDALLDHHQRDAVFWVGRLAPAQSVEVPEARLVHAYVTAGAAELEGHGRIDALDEVRISDAGTRRMTALDDGAEVLIWELHADLDEHLPTLRGR